MKAGDLPLPQIRRILEIGRARELDITAADLIYGREVADEPVVVGA